jgi:hypothetical protein
MRKAPRTSPTTNAPPHVTATMMVPLVERNAIICASPSVRHRKSESQHPRPALPRRPRLATVRRTGRYLPRKPWTASATPRRAAAAPTTSVTTILVRPPATVNSAEYRAAGAGSFIARRFIDTQDGVNTGANGKRFCAATGWLDDQTCAIPHLSSPAGRSRLGPLAHSWRAPFSVRERVSRPRASKAYGHSMRLGLTLAVVGTFVGIGTVIALYLIIAYLHRG